MATKKLTEFLDANDVEYDTFIHPIAYTTRELAALVPVKLAKTVIVKIDDQLAMAVLPGRCNVDLLQLKAVAGAKTAVLANEEEFRGRFPECETGAMPPFGNLYRMPVFVEESITKDRQIAFNAGTHNELIRLSYEDFARLVQPTVARFALRQAA